MEIYKRIKELRIEKGLTQEELAEKIGVAHKIVCFWEAGSRKPTLTNVFNLAIFFGVSADYLLGMTDKRRKS